MITAKHHIVIYPLFKWLTKYLLRRNFYEVVVDGDYIRQDNPLLVVSNHISWWDGFWIMHLNLTLIRKRFHFMMLEESLRRHWYFRYAGGYSVQKKSKSIVESIGYTVDLLRNAENMVFIFPQGRISSAYNDRIKFERGVERILEKAPNNLDILLVANFVDYLSRSKPTLFTYIKQYRAASLKEQSVEQVYAMFYENVLQRQKEKVS